MGGKPMDKSLFDIAIGEGTSLPRVFAQSQARIETGLTITRGADGPRTGEWPRVVGDHHPCQIGVRLLVADSAVPALSAIIGRGMNKEDRGRVRAGRSGVMQGPGAGACIVRRRRRVIGLKPRLQDVTAPDGDSRHQDENNRKARIADPLAQGQARHPHR
ncbi:hypothetical protein D3C75_746490 [compost metagenome]